MNLETNKLTEKLQDSILIKKLTKELSETLDCFNVENNLKIEDVKLTQKEELEFYREKTRFLQSYFKEEQSNMSEDKIYLVTNKYENDYEYHRYKVAEYLEGHERKYITFKKDLPENVQIGDMVRKVEGKYIYDEQATRYVRNTINEIKQNIINKRGK